MKIFTYIGDKIGSGKVFRALRKSEDLLGSLLRENDESERRKRQALLGLIKEILAENGEIPAPRLALLREALDLFSPEDAIRLLADIRRFAPLDAKAAAPMLADLSGNEKRKLVRFLYDLAVADGVDDRKTVVAEELAAQFSISEKERQTMQIAAETEKTARRHLLHSGAGILAALGVILIFILMATWLRPVAFGLIFAYILLPLEKFFERRLRDKKGLGYRFFGVVDFVMRPLHALARLLGKRLHPEVAPDETDDARAEEKRRIVRAATLTFFSVIVVLSLLFAGIWGGAGRYFRTIENAMPSHRGGVSEESQIVNALNRASDRFAQQPAVRAALRKVAQVISDPQARRNIGAFFLQRSGGVFSFTADVLGMLAAFAVDFLLALIFGLFFLLKLAEFCQSDKSTGKKGEYLVRTVFNGDWLPGAGESVVGEATRLIGGILVRLQVWARGYLSLVVLDIVVYTLGFALIGVPHCILAGVVAGCSVLLPVIGVTGSLVFTLLLTLAFGGSGIQLAMILIFYLVYAGIVEQFITYPAIIGDSLGLTSLETIIVVLLGGVLAGIPGMLLALPSASVAKYLVPQIYRCWETRQNFPQNES